MRPRFHRTFAIPTAMPMLAARPSAPGSFVFALLVAISGIAMPGACAEDLIRIEEDWELIVGEPGPFGGMPQITTTMSPVGDLEGLRLLFTLNLDGDPEYESGGLRVMAWESNVPGPAKLFGVGTPLRVRNERITWTQVMTIERGGLSFAIVNGRSQTWGDFGEGNSLRLKVRSRVVNFNDYSQDNSVYSSGISGTRLTPTRVQTLLLRQVRWYSPEGLSYQDNQLRVVY